MNSTSSYSADTRAATTAISSGIASIILALLFLTPWVGSFVLYGGAVLGITGVVSGVLAVKRGQPKGIAVTGIATGCVGFLACAGILIFTLVFVGAFSA